LTFKYSHNEKIIIDRFQFVQPCGRGSTFWGGLFILNMAEGKNKIIIYRDWISIFNTLEPDEAGRLIQHLFAYVNDQNPEPPDRLTALLFEPIKNQLKRDLKKWEEVQERNATNGKLGGRPKKENPEEPKETQNNPVGFSETQNNPEKGDTVIIDTVIVDTVITDNDILLKKETKKISKKKSIDFSIPLEKRREMFYESLFDFELDYGKKMVQDFFLYWAEKTMDGKSMRFEIQKTWEPKMRLERWKRNNFNSLNDGKPTKAEQREQAMRDYLNR